MRGVRRHSLLWGEDCKLGRDKHGETAEFLARLLTHADVFFHWFFFFFFNLHWFFSKPAPWVPTQSHTLYSLLMTQEWAGTGSPGRLPFCESGERTVFSQLHSPHPCSSLCSFPELLCPGLYCGPPWPCQSCLGCASCAPQGGLTQDETKPAAVLINSESH